MRLVGGDKGFSGRVEVCGGGEWGTVCAEGFTQELAMTVCKKVKAELAGGCVASVADGIPQMFIFVFPVLPGVIVSAPGLFGEGEGVVYVPLPADTCAGPSCSLSDYLREDDMGECAHGNDVGVFCTQSCMSAHIALLQVSCA